MLQKTVNLSIASKRLVYMQLSIVRIAVQKFDIDERESGALKYRIELFFEVKVAQKSTN